MGLIKLKDVPGELHRRLKAEAAAAGMTLPGWCIRILGGNHGKEGVALAETSVQVVRDSRRDADVPMESNARGLRRESEPVLRPDMFGKGAGLPEGSDEVGAEDEEPDPHDPEFCQQPGCRECRKLREGN